MGSIDTILEAASGFINKEFNAGIEISKLKPYSPKDWQEFCNVNGFNPKTEGLYIPESYSAYVDTGSPVLISNIFHELFGHGLFCEHSKIGKELVEKAKNGEDVNSYLYDDVDSKNQPFGLAKQNIGNYEGFALWLESILCEATDSQGLWETKRGRLPDAYQSLFEYFAQAEQKMTRLGFMSQLGFPKFYDDNSLLAAVKAVYGSKFSDVDLIVLYGSRKPESDIDIFVVSEDRSVNYDNGWLDIYQLKREEFEELVRKLDISATIGFFTGEPVYDPGGIFCKYRQQIVNQPITSEAINHNYERAEQLKQNLLFFEDNPEKEKTCIGYIDSYTKMADALREGRKLYTLDDMKII